MIDKQAFYEEHHKALGEQIQSVSAFFMQYPGSRYREEALKKIEECYLWGTQMIQGLLRDSLEAEAIALKAEEEKKLAEEAAAKAPEECTDDHNIGCAHAELANAV